MRLIDADALLQEMMKTRASLQMLDNTQSADKMMHGLRMAEIKVEEAPTIEPKRGEWHRSLSDCEEGWVTCNNCGMQFDYYLLDQLGAEIENVYFTNFCPNCGADMRKEK